jgi:dienelactone hydrolase
MTLRPLACFVVLALGVATTTAQEMRFFYPAPSPAQVQASKDVPYGDLQMDVYRPVSTVGEAMPALVFFNTASGAQRSSPFYKAWAEVAAAQQVVAILPDLRDDSVEKDFDALMAHLTSEGARLGIDPERIVVHAGSGNVFRALPIVMDPRRTSVKAAVMFYGSAPVREFRRDLPLLYVRAGLDRPPVNRAISDLVALAVNQNAPVTLLNYPAGHHAFEIVDDEDATREVIDRAIAFVKQATRPAFQASLHRGIPESTAAAQVSSGRFAEAAATYAALVKSSPADARLRLAYGEALLGASRFADACTELETLKGKGLGPRDLGVPGARACMQKGDGDAAIAWLKTIPPRFLPQEIENDPIFSPIKARPDFLALFKAAH